MAQGEIGQTEPWRFERRVTHSPRLWARMCAEALRFRAMRVARIIAAGPCLQIARSAIPAISRLYPGYIPAMSHVGRLVLPRSGNPTNTHTPVTDRQPH
eukprot:5051177-Prymnesium_polylepis.1